MFSERFLKFIEMWQKDFAIERTIDQKQCVDRDGAPIPWYTYPAIEYLSQFDYAGKKVFEYGCGNSSLFWAARAGKVVSVEDNPQWFAKWQKEFSVPGLEICLCDEKAGYEETIFASGEKYDVIVVDGKRRAQCATAAVRALETGGIVILDDSDRVNTSKEYQKAVQILKAADLLQVDFYGFCPMNVYSKATSVFFSREFRFPLKYNIQPVNGLGNLWSLSRRDRKALYRSQK